jgi:hypothetical protein
MSDPEKKPSSKTAIVFWVVAVCFCAVLVTAITIPNFVRARPPHVPSACINNLRQIDAAARQFALEKGKKVGDPISFPEDLTPYIKLDSHGKVPQCPAGGTYSIKKVGELPTCSLGSIATPPHVLPRAWRRSILP